MQIKRDIIAALLVVLMGASCSSGGGSPKSKGVKMTSGLVNESDSLAYIVGMNIAEQLQKMDSMINYGVVCRAIMERSEGASLMSDDEAQVQYLRYLLHVDPERVRQYEEQFLADLATNNREYTRTKSGVTYNIEVIGDEKLQPKSSNDWVTMNFSISRVGGDKIYPAADSSEEYATMEESINNLPSGIAESLKMIGKGGKIKAWIPSKLAYREDGNEEFGVEPTETIFIEIELANVEKGAAAEKLKVREREQF